MSSSRLPKKLKTACKAHTNYDIQKLQLLVPLQAKWSIAIKSTKGVQKMHNISTFKWTAFVCNALKRQLGKICAKPNLLGNLCLMQMGCDAFEWNCNAYMLGIAMYLRRGGWNRHGRKEKWNLWIAIHRPGDIFISVLTYNILLSLIGACRPFITYR